MKHYNLYINSAPEVAGVHASWSGSNLTAGSSSQPVRMIQEQLNAIANVYGDILKVAVDGRLGYC